MPSDSKLELVVEVDVNTANASIKNVNTGLPGNALSTSPPMEHAASQVANGASDGIDGTTACIVKGTAAGSLIAESIKKASSGGVMDHRSRELRGAHRQDGLVDG